MNTAPTVLSTLPRAILKATASYQVDTAELLRRADLSASVFESPNLRIPGPAVRRLWSVAVQLTGDPCLGLVAAGHHHDTSFHSLGFAWMASPTFREMLKRLVRYERVLMNTHWAVLEQTGHATALRLLPPNDEEPAASCRSDSVFAALAAWGRRLGGETLAPSSVEFRHDDHGQRWRYEEALVAPLRFGAETDRIWFADDVLDRVLPGGNAALAAEADRIADAYLAGISDEPTARRVRQCLVDLLPQAEAELENVAARLFMSPRSLQRHLADEGHGFRALLEETRRTLAMQDGKHPLADIAFRLGFSDQSAFSKAYRRWTGMSPAQQQAAMRSR